MLYKVVVDVPYSVRREVLPAYPCVSFLLIENTGAKWPVLVHGTAIYAAKRTLSAARLSDILRGSYRLSPQSPASSQCLRGLPDMVSPAQAHLSYCIGGILSSIFSLFFIKFSCKFWRLRRKQNSFSGAQKEGAPRPPPVLRYLLYAVDQVFSSASQSGTGRIVSQSS